MIDGSLRRCRRRSRGRGAAALRDRPRAASSLPAISSPKIVQAGYGRNRAGRAARHRRCASASAVRSCTDRILSTCSWSCTTATAHIGMIEHIGHLGRHGVGIDRHRNGAERLRGQDRGSKAAGRLLPAIATVSPRRMPRLLRPSAMRTHLAIEGRTRSRSARCRDPYAAMRDAHRARARDGSEVSETYPSAASGAVDNITSSQFAALNHARSQADGRRFPALSPSSLDKKSGAVSAVKPTEDEERRRLVIRRL